MSETALTFEAAMSRLEKIVANGPVFFADARCAVSNDANRLVWPVTDDGT